MSLHSNAFFAKDNRCRNLLVVVTDSLRCLDGELIKYTIYNMQQAWADVVDSDDDTDDDSMGAWCTLNQVLVWDQ